MAAQSETRNRFSYGQELPPITLSNTSISSLVSLIPVLVALTSSARKPCFDNENDKPAWWPEDIQWKNPKHYSTYMGDNILKILRKVVHSCYTYHGVEGLLCRLDGTRLSESEVVDISDDGGTDKEGNNGSPENDGGPVFVCCFCLEEFNSHEKVNIHQRFCRDKSHDTEAIVEEDLTDIQFNNPPFSECPRPVSLSAVRVPVSGLQCQQSSNSNSTVNGKTTKTSTGESNEVKKCRSSGSSKRQPANKVVPILKTRSQKKLDQIMDRHKQKQLMFKECRELKDVPKTGAWWVRKQRRCSIHKRSTSHYPNERFTKSDFLSNVGLTLKLDKESEQKEKDKIEVDLDCEIICVEGPLSHMPCPLPSDNSNSLSPRASKSIMSQLSRDDSSSHQSRRRMSFCFVEDEWADKEALEEGRDPLQLSLLTLDLSSPLGQRIKKYVNADGQMNVVKDVELCCRTDARDENKLRVRACDFKVTFKKKCRASNYVHTYKFNKSDVHEFKTRLLTGLSWRSRNLQKRLPRCKLVLKKLTDKDIKLFNEVKKVTIAKNIVVDEDLCITQIDVPQSLIESHKNRRLNPPPTSSLPPSTTSSHPSHHPLRQQQSHSHQVKRPHPKPVPPHLRHGQAAPGPKGAFLQRPFPLFGPSSSHSPPPSSPHIPNIFRNRPNSNTPSPPRPISAPKVDAWKYSHADYKRSLMNLAAQTSHQQQQQERKSPSPSGFSSGVIISERRPIIANSSNSNRRKQLMNQLRQDDLMERNSSRKEQAKNFVNLADASSKYKNSPSSSSHSSSSATAATSHSHPSVRPQLSGFKNTHSKPQDLSKLSNFEYFSIKQGKLLSGHSISSPSPSNNNRNSPTVEGDRRKAVESTSHNSHPQHRNSNPLAQTAQSPSYCAVPSQGNSSIQSPSHRNATVPFQRNSSSNLPRKSPQLGPQRNSMTVPSLSNHQQKPTVKPGLSGHDQHREVSRLQLSSIPGPSPPKKTNSGPVSSVDDDVMEVICIDD